MARSTKFNITVTESTDEELKYEFGCGKFMDFFVEPLVKDLIENHLDELIIKKDLKQDHAKIVPSQIILL